jgi:hypothetical protein
MTKEQIRLSECRSRTNHWKRWGPYLSERAWGTMREDYSARGNGWEYFPHDHARSRVYRWNEDGLAGICDRHQYICFAIALWNERNPILKERLFGLSGNEGNHGEDVKEQYFYLDNTPDSFVCGRDVRTRTSQSVARIQAPLGMVYRSPSGPYRQIGLYANTGPRRTSVAFDHKPGTATTYSRLYAGRARIPIALRHSCAVTISSRPSIYSSSQWN